MTTHAVLFRDAEQVVVTALEAGLAELGATATVSNRVPDPRTLPFVKVLRTGGVRANLVADKPTLTIEAWAEDDAAAHDLAAQCRYVVALMRGQTIHGATIYRVEEASGPVNLPDPSSSDARYTFTCAIAMRGAKPT